MPKQETQDHNQGKELACPCSTRQVSKTKETIELATDISKFLFMLRGDTSSIKKKVYK